MLDYLYAMQKAALTQRFAVNGCKPLSMPFCQHLFAA